MYNRNCFPNFANHYLPTRNFRNYIQLLATFNIVTEFASTREGYSKSRKEPVAGVSKRIIMPNKEA